jgi:hypothetical protein
VREDERATPTLLPDPEMVIDGRKLYYFAHHRVDPVDILNSLQGVKSVKNRIKET